MVCCNLAFYLSKLTASASLRVPGLPHLGAALPDLPRYWKGEAHYWRNATIMQPGCSFVQHWVELLPSVPGAYLTLSVVGHTMRHLSHLLMAPSPGFLWIALL